MYTVKQNSAGLRLVYYNATDEYKLWFQDKDVEPRQTMRDKKWALQQFKDWEARLSQKK